VTDRAPVVLASSSPRRRVLLAMIQVPVDLRPADIDEAALGDSLDPLEAVVLLARAKAEAVDGDGRPVLAADTIVSLDGAQLNKPADRHDAAAMLRRQSGKVVQVVSCVALKNADGVVDDRVAISTLQVAELDQPTITAYLATGEADDKAGALAVQGPAKDFVTIIDGSRSNVVGLPLAETAELLRDAGIAVADTRPGVA
jgi:septum formation protein